MVDLNFTVARPEDRALIQAVVHRYAYNAREGLFDPDVDTVGIDDMLALFTPDAIIVLPGGIELPATELSTVVQGAEATYIRHHITTVDIRFHGDADAETDTSFFANTDEAAPDHWGHWHDHFRRLSDGTWRIHRREIVTEGGAPGGWFHRVWATSEKAQALVDTGAR